jgi:hypothetical protein
VSLALKRIINIIKEVFGFDQSMRTAPSPTTIEFYLEIIGLHIAKHISNGKNETLFCMIRVVQN